MSYKILYLSRLYPNNIVGVNGLWVEGLVTAMSRLNDVRVISPVAYCPPLPQFISYAKNRKILKKEIVNGVDVFRPRFLAPPGYVLHSCVGELLYWSIVRKVDQYRKKFPFELIHAHFSYPDGYVAAKFAKRYNIPLVITEHAAWRPWMDDFPAVRKQAVWATGVSNNVIAGSRYLADTITHFTQQPSKISRIPIGVNTQLFKPAEIEKKPQQILYVGRIHKTKGVDVLFNAIKILIDRGFDIRLVIVGGNLGFKNYQVQEDKMRQLATELRINPYLDFVGMKQPEQVKTLMQESALLVLPSRRETFGTVLIEAIACGTPVVATRCGGPEDFVNDDVGILVDKENSQALANGLEKIISTQKKYCAQTLFGYAHAGFSWESVAIKTNEIYKKLLS